MNIEIDHAALRAVTSGLTTAGRTFDKTGSGAPGQPDAGWADGALAEIMLGFSEASARLVGTAVTLAAAGETCNVEHETTDSAAAEQFLILATEEAGG